MNIRKMSGGVHSIFQIQFEPHVARRHELVLALRIFKAA